MEVEGTQRFLFKSCVQAPALAKRYEDDMGWIWATCSCVDLFSDLWAMHGC